MKGILTTMNKSLETTLKEFISLKQAIEASTETLKSLEQSIKDEIIAQDIKKIEIEGKSVTLVQAEQRSFNAEELQKLISASVFKQVTEPAVKSKLFDAAVSLGKIKTEVVEKVTSKKPYSQLRVN